MNTTQGPFLVAHKKSVMLDAPEGSAVIEGDFTVVQTADGKIIALITSDNPDADAALFAASPNMLDALIATQEATSMAFEKIHAEAE